jgi:DDE superfamily endonuclease
MASVPRTGQRNKVKRARRRTKQQAKRFKARVRAARRKLEDTEQMMPCTARSLLDVLAAVFTRPTYLRVVVLLAAAILTTGRHTVLNVLRTAGTLAPGAASSYHRVFSRRRWKPLELARGLAGWVVCCFVPIGCIRLVGDDTVDEHPGRKVFGKGKHRDPVRSSHSYTAFRWGHKWVVLAVLVRFPFAHRPWALPILVALHRPRDKNIKGKRRHKTPADWMRQMLRLVLRWFPHRQFIFAGDGGYGTHDLAITAARSHGRLTVVSRFYGNAALYDPPRAQKRRGRRRVRGVKRAKPETAVAKAKSRKRLHVSWYGGGHRDVSVVSSTGHWYQSGAGLAPVLWVHVRDCTGTHRDEYFFTTDVAMDIAELIEMYTARWSIEVTFQEMRSYIGLETTRGRSERTVLRAAPSLFGLYTIVACWYAQLPLRYRRERGVHWIGKMDVTFSDAITAVRRWLWQEWIFAIPGHSRVFQKISRPFRAVLLYALAPVA